MHVRDDIRHRFYERHSDASAVEARAAEAAEAAARWAARHPLVRQVRARPLSMLLAAAAPTCAVDELVSQTCAMLWVFATDDLFDDPGSSDAELAHLAESVYPAVRGERSGRSDEHALAAIVREVREDLARYPLFEALQIKWADVMSKTVDGMRLERAFQVERRRGSTALPRYADYLESGGYSIGAHANAWTVIATLGDASASAHLDSLHEIISASAVAIRLVNDLRSHDKEVLEGNVNAVVIFSDPLVRGGQSLVKAEREARARVDADVDAALSRVDSLLAAPRTDTGRPERVVATTAHLARAFYERHDFHTFDAGGEAPPAPAVRVELPMSNPGQANRVDAP